MADLDFTGLNRRLLSRSRELVPVWLPGGRLQGKEYVCGGLRGGPGSSMAVNVETGKWGDFADADVKGGDLISLYAAVYGLKQGEAAKRLAEDVGYRLRPDRDPAPGRSSKKTPSKNGHVSPQTSDARETSMVTAEPAKVSAMILPPDSAETPSFLHPIHGSPASIWTYRDEAGRQMFHVARYEEADGKKLFAPWSWSRETNGWVMKGWDSPRPLYGLDILAEHPNQPVMVVEGEKAAEAARRMAGKVYSVVSWPNGSQAAKNASWGVLKGRKVLLWPDADRKIADTPAKAEKYDIGLGHTIPYEHQPGPRAMAEIAAILSHICPEVKVLNVGIDLERADGWDAADAEADGWTWATLIIWARPRAAVWEPTKEARPELNLTVQTAVQTNVVVQDKDERDESPSLYASWEDLGIILSAQGSPIANVDNALRVIERHQDFKEITWFDEFHHKYLTTWKSEKAREWQDVDDLNLMGFMQRGLGMRRMSDDMVRKAAIILAHKNVRNEPRDWLEKLTWDETPRLTEFFIKGFGAEDNEYVRAAARNFWIGMVARIFRPGCQVDNMIVLEGAQGAGKTRALRLIGGPWYAEAHESVTDKDFFMVLHGKLIVEIAELDAFSRAEVTRIKQVVSCTTDRYRAPYGRTAQDHPRMSVFVGTTNEKSYLRDNTGGRRFWPISCTTIDHAYLAQFRDQLYAEAVVGFKKWVKTQADEDGWWLMPAQATAAVQEERRQVDEWENILEGFLKHKIEVRMHEMAMDALKIDAARLDRFVQQRIAGILRAMGWDKHNVTREGVQMKVWRKTGAEGDEPPPEDDIF